MDDADQFHHLFAQAKAHGLTLNQFSQNDGGGFTVNWRRVLVDEPATERTKTTDSVFSTPASSTDPFHAMKDALAIAIRTLPKPQPAPALRRRVL